MLVRLCFLFLFYRRALTLVFLCFSFLPLRQEMTKSVFFQNRHLHTLRLGFDEVFESVDAWDGTELFSGFRVGNQRPPSEKHLPLFYWLYLTKCFFLISLRRPFVLGCSYHFSLELIFVGFLAFSCKV